MITVIGLGFVGLTTALGFCRKGFKVYGVDINEKVLETIQTGKAPFYEPFINDILEQNINKMFFPTDDLGKAINNSEYVFICVGTPSRSNGSVDLSHIFTALGNILKAIRKPGYKILIIKSTVPPLTAEEEIKPLMEKFGYTIGKDIGLVSNPEFLREGCSWNDFINPDRIVIGESDEKSGLLVKELYESFKAPIFRVSLNTAEFIKYLSNTLLATMISFSNDMSMLACSLGEIDIKNAFKILHLDRRWYGKPADMKNYIYPGCGFGGYCLPKDTKAIYAKAKEKNYFSTMLKATLDVNIYIKEFVVEKICKEVINKNENIGILGLAFKPGSDDVRETPAKSIIEMLIKSGFGNIIAYDPVANERFNRTFGLPVKYVSSKDELVSEADNIIILTACEEFRKMGRLPPDKKIFDFRYILDENYPV